MNVIRLAENTHTHTIYLPISVCKIETTIRIRCGCVIFNKYVNTCMQTEKLFFSLISVVASFYFSNILHDAFGVMEKIKRKTDDPEPQPHILGDSSIYIIAIWWQRLSENIISVKKWCRTLKY